MTPTQKRPVLSQAPSLKRNSAGSKGGGARCASEPDAKSSRNIPARSATTAPGGSEARAKAPISLGIGQECCDIVRDIVTI